MDASRELDELVAREVIYQTDFEHGEIEETATGHPACVRCGEVGHWDDKIFGDTKCIKRYSSDITAAFEVIEQMKERGAFLIRLTNVDKWSCTFYGARLGQATGIQGEVEQVESPALAICIAALRAIGIEG